MARILFLAHRVPYPPDKGDRIRAFHTLRHLSKSHEVSLGALSDGSLDRTAQDWLAAHCRDIAIMPRTGLWTALRIARGAVAGQPLSVAAFAHPGLARWCRGIAQPVKPDLVYVYSSAMAQYADPSVPRITDFVDVDSEKFRDYARRHASPRRLLYRREAAALLRHDIEVAQRSGACLFVSQDECDLFTRLSPATQARHHVVANGVDCSYFKPDRGGAADPVILFTGRMDYLPNIDAVSWFAKSIFPKVRARMPDAVFRIAGAVPTRAVRRLADEAGIEVTGAVADMRPFYETARVCVAPMRIARGIQNKVLEAMAMAKPVVATPEALEGISAVAGDHLLLARSEEEFGNAVIEALSGLIPGDIGTRARENVLLMHEWSAGLTKLDRIIDDVLRRGFC